MSPSTFCAAMAGMLTLSCGQSQLLRIESAEQVSLRGELLLVWDLVSICPSGSTNSREQVIFTKAKHFPRKLIEPPPFTTTISFHASMFQGPVMVATHLQPPHPSPNPSLAPEAYWEWELEPKVAAKADGNFDFGGNLPFHREHRL